MLWGGGGGNVENLFWLNFVLNQKKRTKNEIIFFEIFFGNYFLEIIFWKLFFGIFIFIFFPFFFKYFFLPQHVILSIVHCLLRLTTQAYSNL